jgi:hypothetical protein
MENALPLGVDAPTGPAQAWRASRNNRQQLLKRYVVGALYGDASVADQ